MHPLHSDTPAHQAVGGILGIGAAPYHGLKRSVKKKLTEAAGASAARDLGAKRAAARAAMSPEETGAVKAYYDNLAYLSPAEIQIRENSRLNNLWDEHSQKTGEYTRQQEDNYRTRLNTLVADPQSTLADLAAYIMEAKKDMGFQFDFEGGEAYGLNPSQRNHLSASLQKAYKNARALRRQYEKSGFPEFGDETFTDKGEVVPSTTKPKQKSRKPNNWGKWDAERKMGLHPGK